MRRKESLTYTQAVTVYFGGIEALSNAKLPFKCKDCGGTTYPFIEKVKKANKDELPQIPVNKAIFSVPEIFIHIRKIHRVILKKGAK